MSEGERNFDPEFTEMMVQFAGRSPQIQELRVAYDSDMISDETLNIRLSDVGRWFGLQSLEDIQRAFFEVVEEY